jgi:hypothetical protein
VNETKEALADIAKLGRAVKLVAEDLNLELKMFGVTPDLDTGDLNVATIVLLLDPEGETKPKMELVKMEGAVTEAMEDAYRERMAGAADRAKRDLTDLDDRLKRRGGFLE